MYRYSNGQIRLAKRKYGMGLATAKLREPAAHVIAMSILVLNLCKIQCACLRLLLELRVIFWPIKRRLLFSKHEIVCLYNYLQLK